MRSGEVRGNHSFRSQDSRKAGQRELVPPSGVKTPRRGEPFFPVLGPTLGRRDRETGPPPPVLGPQGGRVGKGDPTCIPLGRAE